MIAYVYMYMLTPVGDGFILNSNDKLKCYNYRLLVDYGNICTSYCAE